MKVSSNEAVTSLIKGSSCLMRFGANALPTALRNRRWSFPSLSTVLGTSGYPLLSSTNTAGENLTAGRKASFDEKRSGWLKIVKISSYLVTTQVSRSELKKIGSSLRARAYKG